MIDPRTRVAAVAGSMALTTSLVLAPVAVAQDSPADTIMGFMDAVVAKDFEALPGFFCEAEAEQAAQFDISALAGEMPEGLDVSGLLDAFVFEVNLESTEVVSESEDEAVVRVVGSMAMDLNEEALVPFVETIIEMSGMEADEATVGMFMSIVASEFEAQSESIDADVTLVPGDDGWLICSDLDFGGAETVDEDMDDMSDDDLDDMSDDDLDDDDMDDDLSDDEMEEDGE
ncbi:MAG: hypothetical protein AB1Z66_08220 [Candidatus Limnocylindrales bacterium]